jgi:hypothetical protein
MDKEFAMIVNLALSALMYVLLDLLLILPPAVILALANHPALVPPMHVLLLYIVNMDMLLDLMDAILVNVIDVLLNVIWLVNMDSSLILILDVNSANVILLLAMLIYLLALLLVVSDTKLILPPDVVHVTVKLVIPK